MPKAVLNFSFHIKNRIYFILFLFLVFQACEIVNPTSDVPAYIKIQKIQFNSDLHSQGEASQKITDVWTHVNNRFLGTFELPTIFPVLETGKKSVRINAGVKENGISATRKIYPFYQAYDTEIEFHKEATNHLEPSFTYHPNTKFEVIEGFEGVKWKFEPATNSDAEIDTAGVDETHPNFGGEHCLKAKLTNINSFFAIVSPVFSSFRQGKAAWMEIDFKTDVPVNVSIINLNTGTRHDFLTLNLTKQWNKVYINFTDIAAGYPTGTSYRIFLYANNQNASETEYVFMDNIKILYFE